MILYIIYYTILRYIILLLVQFLVKSSNPDLARDNSANPPQPRCDIDCQMYIEKYYLLKMNIYQIYFKVSSTGIVFIADG